jgi:hypothetical protein
VQRHAEKEEKKIWKVSQLRKRIGGGFTLLAKGKGGEERASQPRRFLPFTF